MSTRRRRYSKAGRALTFSAALALATSPWLFGERPVRAQETVSAQLTVDQLRRMTGAELEALYRQGTAAAIPEGRIRGTALLAVPDPLVSECGARHCLD